MNRFPKQRIYCFRCEKLEMLTAAFAMQENSVESGSAGGLAVDRVMPGFYS